MTLPKKRKGFRLINVEEQSYCWRFNRTIDIRPQNHQNNKLIIDFGWYDTLLYLNDHENTAETFEPKIITPNFVRKSILAAIKLGWKTHNKIGKLELKYLHGKFEKSDH